MSNLEDFFINRYKEMEEENASLSKRIAEMRADSEYGVFVTGKDVQCVSVTTVSSCYLDEGCFRGLDSAGVEKKKADIANAENWRLSYRNAIEVSESTFPFSFVVKMPGIERSYLVDTRGRVHEANRGEPILDEWCGSSHKEYLLDQARQELLFAMDKRIEHLRKKEAENA